MKIETFKIENISEDYLLKSISFPSNEEYSRLKDSILKYGIQSPIVIFEKDSKLNIIDGYKRFNIAKLEKINSINCIVVNHICEENLIIKYTLYNSFRKLNDVETATLITTLIENYPPLLPKIFEILELKYSEKQIQYFKNITKLNFKFKLLLVENQLNRNIIQRLSSLSDTEQEIYFNIFKTLRLNNNKQKKCFDMINDLILRDNTDIKNLLHQIYPNLINSGYSKDMEDTFFSKLQKLHSPEYFNFHNLIEDFKDKLKLSRSGINIYSPSFYEDGIFKTEIFFKNIDELAKKVKFLEKKIDEIKDNEEFRKIFNY